VNERKIASRHGVNGNCPRSFSNRAMTKFAVAGEGCCRHSAISASRAANHSSRATWSSICCRWFRGSDIGIWLSA